MDTCSNCGRKYRLTKFDYSDGGCKHTDMEGYVCMAFADEGEAVWMVGADEEKDLCECYQEKKTGFVARDCFDRVLSENDTMREQLASIGKKVGDSMDDVKKVETAEWIVEMRSNGWADWDDYTCPICGKKFEDFYHSNYCPNCGNRMINNG